MVFHIETINAIEVFEKCIAMCLSMGVNWNWIGAIRFAVRPGGWVEEKRKWWTYWNWPHSHHWQRKSISEPSCQWLIINRQGHDEKEGGGRISETEGIKSSSPLHLQLNRIIQLQLQIEHVYWVGCLCIECHLVLFYLCPSRRFFCYRNGKNNLLWMNSFQSMVVAFILYVSGGRNRGSLSMTNQIHHVFHSYASYKPPFLLRKFLVHVTHSRVCSSRVWNQHQMPVATGHYQSILNKTNAHDYH